MSDITERLRRWSHDVNAVPASDLMDEAADRIELDARTISALIADGQAMKDRIVNGERARWIPVTERPSKTDEQAVLGFGLPYALPAIAIWESGGLLWATRPNIISQNGRANTPTHWMPLPAPPTDPK